MIRVKEIKNTDGTIWVDPEYVDWLCFTDVSGSSNTLTLTKTDTGGQAPTVSLEYSADKVNWTTWTENNGVRTYTIPADGKVYFRGDNTAFGTAQNDTDCHTFSSTGNVEASGNLMTLFDKTGRSETVGGGAFRNLFKSWTTLKTAPSLTLSSIGGSYCCANMFYGCSSLTDASNIRLNAVTVTDHAYYYMFYGCSLLTAAPVFTASDITVGNHGMNGMFRSTSLTTAPSVKIASEGVQSTDSTFRECSSLTDASNFRLNATSLDKRSCYTMFQDCSNLVTPPEIMATVLYGSSSDSGNGSLAGMFRNCSKLNTIKVHFTSWNTQATQNWTYGCKNSGTFYKPSSLASTKNASGNKSNPHYIPYNWTVTNI